MFQTTNQYTVQYQSTDDGSSNPVDQQPGATRTVPISKPQSRRAALLSAGSESTPKNAQS